MSWNLNTNSIFKISLDRQLPTGMIPLDVLHNINNKQPQELIIPLLNVANMDIKPPKNTVLGSLTRVSNIDSIQNVSYKKMQSTSDKACEKTLQQLQVQSLLQVFPEQSNFQTHAHDDNKPPIRLQYVNVPPLIQNKLNAMLNNKFTCIISKSPTDFGRTNLVEMDLPTTGPPVETKPYTIPLKYKSFMADEIKHPEDAGCISKSLSDWVSPICIVKKPDPVNCKNPSFGCV